MANVVLISSQVVFEQTLQLRRQHDGTAVRVAHYFGPFAGIVQIIKVVRSIAGDINMNLLKPIVGMNCSSSVIRRYLEPLASFEFPTYFSSCAEYTQSSRALSPLLWRRFVTELYAFNFVESLGDLASG